jgi:hypothetical protein
LNSALRCRRLRLLIWLYFGLVALKNQLNSDLRALCYMPSELGHGTVEKLSHFYTKSALPSLQDVFWVILGEALGRALRVSFEFPPNFQFPVNYKLFICLFKTMISLKS